MGFVVHITARRWLPSMDLCTLASFASNVAGSLADAFKHRIDWANGWNEDTLSAVTAGAERVANSLNNSYDYLAIMEHVEFPKAG